MYFTSVRNCLDGFDVFGLFFRYFCTHHDQGIIPFQGLWRPAVSEMFPFSTAVTFPEGKYDQFHVLERWFGYLLEVFSHSSHDLHVIFTFVTS